MKKFEENDVFVNKVRAYPKVSFFVYNGKVFYNNTDEEGIVLNSFLTANIENYKAAVAASPTSPEGILTEDLELILTENGDYLIVE